MRLTEVQPEDYDGYAIIGELSHDTSNVYLVACSLSGDL